MQTKRASLFRLFFQPRRNAFPLVTAFSDLASPPSANTFCGKPLAAHLVAPSYGPLEDSPRQLTKRERESLSPEILLLPPVRGTLLSVQPGMAARKSGHPPTTADPAYLSRDQRWEDSSTKEKERQKRKWKHPRPPLFLRPTGERRKARERTSGRRRPHGEHTRWSRVSVGR